MRSLVAFVTPITLAAAAARAAAFAFTLCPYPGTAQAVRTSPPSLAATHCPPDLRLMARVAVPLCWC